MTATEARTLKPGAIVWTMSPDRGSLGAPAPLRCEFLGIDRDRTPTPDEPAGVILRLLRPDGHTCLRFASKCSLREIVQEVSPDLAGEGKP